MEVSILPKYELKESEVKIVEEIVSKYKGKKGSLIPVLREIQENIGFLPVDVQKKVAKELNLPEKEVYGVATFYSLFSMIPRGKNNIRVCLGTACYVKGGKKIVEKIEKELNISPGQTTPDRKFSLNVDRCFGCCGIAPVIMINGKVFQRVDPEKVMELVYENEK
ncbi:MAG: NADH-quinone oxidoreductase subunit NuoE [Actinobacteria bacterium]|nr:NADH-quinone oxidoreductase subunit NuoE [Actinomycetota bacterium]